MRAQGEAALPLDHAIHQQAHEREHRQGRNPFGLLEPYGADRRRILDPPKARFHGGVLLLIGLENRTLPPALGAYGRGQDDPAVFLFRHGLDRDLNAEVIAEGHKRWVGLRRASSSCPTCTPCDRDDVIAHRMVAP
jgi:hypothetical protein